MNELIAKIAKTALFSGVSPEGIEKMLLCLSAQEQHFAQGEIILRAGDKTSRMGLVVSGAVHIVRGDVWGNSTIIDRIAPGQFFAEVYACLPNEPLMIDVAAARDSRVLFLDAGKALQECGSRCSCHQALLNNLLLIMASRNLSLTRKITHITERGLRARLLSYLSAEALRNGAQEFDIPFNREQLADYLASDRSAVSNELSKMRRDGLIEYKKNHFRILSDD